LQRCTIPELSFVTTSNGPAGMGSGKRLGYIGEWSEGRAQRLPQRLLLGLICEKG
jgi:hypothetical protein